MLSSFEAEEENRLLTEEELTDKHRITTDLHKAFITEDALWSKKARLAWSSGGDRCTRFFHRAVNDRAKENSLDNLLIDGERVCDPGLLVHHIENLYSSLYSETCSDRPELPDVSLKRLTSERAYNLAEPFHEAEIWGVLNDLEGDKTPGPDGFPIKFDKFCWKFMKSDILMVFDEFFKNQFLEWHLNTTFLSLIPKVTWKKSVNDLGPIALLSGIYKIIAKVLANRLKPCIDDLVSTFQCANNVAR